MARPALAEKELQHTVILELGPLVAPYRKKGRISVRIERMPQTARLSHGTRNSEGTWSLQSDELEDIQFMTTEPMVKEHKLSIRVISLSNGNTLASLDYAVKPASETPSLPPAQAFTPSPASSQELDVLRHELAVAKDALAARDAELAERLAAAATVATSQFQQTLAKAETAWTASETARLDAVQEQWQEKFAEAIVDIEEEQRRKYVDEIEALQVSIEELKATLSEREAALAHAKESDDAARAEGSTAARAALDKLAALQTALAERDAELAAAVAAKDAAKRDGEIALVKAEAAWKDAEAERIAQVEARWREESAMALAEAQADAETLRQQGNHSDPDLLEHFTALQAAVAERDAALERAQAAAEQARSDGEARLAAAEAKWTSAEAARFAAADAAWQKRLATAIAERPAPVTTTNDAEVRALREKLASVQAKLDLREAAVARAANLSNEERMRWQKEAQDAIVKAARERKADEAARMATAQAEWSRESLRDLALATSRAEAAEAALAQIRMRTKNDTQLHTELAALRSALSIREQELAAYRHHDAPPDASETAAKKGATRRETVLRDVLLAACVGVIAVMAWPQLSVMLGNPQPTPAPVAAVAAVATPAPQPANPIVALQKEAKLRKAPSPAAEVIAKLKADTKLEVLARHAEWTKVRELDAPAKGKPAEGWVRASLLKFPTAEAPAAK